MDLMEEMNTCCNNDQKIEGFLRQEWDCVCAELGMSPAPEIFTDLIAGYQNPNRGYHSLLHLWWVIKEAKKYMSVMENPAEVMMALFYHDAIYNPRIPDTENVVLSLNRCMDVLRSGEISQNIRINISKIIMGTLHDKPPLSADEALARDIDLSMIIGFAPETIETLMRKEYAFVPEDVYLIARKRVLKSFYLNDHLFLSQPFQEQDSKMRIWLLKMIQYNGARVVVGGTFDLFHKGHRLLIKKAFEYAGKNPSSIVTIGLTSDKTASKKSHIVQPFTVRERQIRNFIAREKYQAGYVIQSLDNPEGDLLSNPDYDFFIASKETEENAKKVLALRNNTDLPPIIPNLIEVVTDGNGRISSTRLRKEMRSN